MIKKYYTTNIPKGSSKTYEVSATWIEFSTTRAYASPFEDIFAELTSLDNLLLHNMQLILPELRQ